MPSLFYLKKKYDLNIIGLYSRTFSNAKKVANNWNLNALSYDTNLLMLDMSMVIISITTTNVISSLLKLENYEKKLKIIIDTPAFINFRDLPILKRLSKKHDIFVASDFMYFPIFNLFREVANSKILGKLKKISLVNTGYYYHGTALLRSFFDFSSFLSIRKIGKVNKIFSALNTNKYIYKFRNSVIASITYPYNFDEGYIELCFEKGIVTNKKICNKKFSDRNKYVVENIVENNFILGHKIEINNLKFTSNTDYIPLLLSFSKNDNTNFNLHKTCGTIDFLKSILIINKKKNMIYCRASMMQQFQNKKLVICLTFLTQFHCLIKTLLVFFGAKKKTIK